MNLGLKKRRSIHTISGARTFLQQPAPASKISMDLKQFPVLLKAGIPTYRYFKEKLLSDISGLHTGMKIRITSATTRKYLEYSTQGSPDSEFCSLEVARKLSRRFNFKIEADDAVTAPVKNSSVSQRTNREVPI